MICGLLGRKLGHSYSPQIHRLLGNYTYLLFEKEPEEIEDFLKNGDFTGINVTVPYKKTVIPYLDELTSTARRIGAVNTIVRRDGHLIGHNTDHFGFQTMVLGSGLEVTGKKVLVLGSGGASNTAVAVLMDLGAEVVVISRSGENHYGNLHLHADASAIVNCTPVGMYPDVGNSPLSLEEFPRLSGILDVIYNPARTKLLLDGEKRDLVTMNGLRMLVAQAAHAAEWFTGIPVPNGKIDEIYGLLRRQTENIILVGMPGCGKSTIARTLAEKTGRRWADSDAIVEKLAKKSIPRIFSEDGESVFRKWETQALAELGKQSSLVIATGGGCVTQAQNYDLLHQNGRIFFLQRDLSLLPVDGRPLSQAEGLSQMYARRRGLYEAFADHAVNNNGTPEQTVAQILAALD